MYGIYDFKTPKEVYEVSTSIAKKCKREIGAICGMDFIYDKNLKKWFYLEEHEHPMLVAYSHEYNLPYSLDENNFMQYHRESDVDARLRSLSLTMKKHNN